MTSQRLCAVIGLLALWLAQLAVARTAVTPVKELRQRPRASPADDDEPDLESLYPAHNLSVPIDHFHNSTLYAPHSNGTFPLRYWYSAAHYAPGGPVIVLCSGETSGVNRLPFLYKGIVYQLAKATGGLGVILEHRYYGTSFPVDDLTTESLRFLTTEQALADTDYFARNVVFEDVDADLSPESAPWIMYGGSYAGAFVAFLRVLYPGTFWGAISSSGVTEAIYDYWQYFEPIRIHGPRACVDTTQAFVRVIDGILLRCPSDADLTARLKETFLLPNVTYDDDFANVLSGGITGWQGRNWDPEVNDPSFGYYCDNITTGELLYPDTEGLRDSVAELIGASGGAAGAAHEDDSSLTDRMLNWIGYVNATAVAPCAADSGSTQNQCFTNRNATYYAQTDLAQTWRAWAYQYCTQWGYLQTGSGAPAHIDPLVSRTIDLEYTSLICRDAFDIWTSSDVQAINRYGGFDISYPRLAIVDGEADPWKEATPHATVARDRASTVEEPFLLIEGAVHHWDENGLLPNETTADLPPQPVADTQATERDFVRAWVAEWYMRKDRRA
ncbi:serine carboxypeptidase S28-domain-containing protein [Lineolata rhizophorae]|uniref:Serine carboxypeptidase S28-domain-containing protein n=1 Tax=Lineolata rhizophorae TaxID=578093 RepID=A0A6A6P3D3_9PEZI|nr:serine carboxypeptidase S28-domain-containing protein [Lineolata rhizophorae]